MDQTTFIIRKVIRPGSDKAGLALAFAESGELVPCQVACTVATVPGGPTVTDVTLRIYNAEIIDETPTAATSREFPER